MLGALIFLVVIEVNAIQGSYFGYLSVIIGAVAITPFLLNGWLFFSVGQQAGLVGESPLDEQEKTNGKKMKYYLITGLVSLVVIFLLMLALTVALPGQVVVSP